MSAAIIFSLVLVLLAALLSLIFSSLTYSLRDFSRPMLTEQLTRLNLANWIDPTIDRANDLIFVTAMARLFANLFVFIGVLHTTRVWIGVHYEWSRYLLAAAVTSVITLFVSVAIPHALAEHMGEPIQLCLSGLSPGEDAEVDNDASVLGERYGQLGAISHRK